MTYEVSVNEAVKLIPVGEVDNYTVEYRIGSEAMVVKPEC